MNSPLTTAAAAFAELAGFDIEHPARAQVLLQRVRLALDAAAEVEHRELFLAAYALLENIDSPAARERACRALAELDAHYGIENPGDVRALDAQHHQATCAALEPA